MRRTLLVGALVLAAAVVGALAYTAYDAEREYERLIVAGDAASAGDQPFQALEAYSGAIALRPDSMLAHLRRGMIYRERGELDAALRDLRVAADLDPSAPQPRELLGDVNAALERYDRAAADYDAYIDLDDRSPAVLYKLALARYRAADTADAIAPLERAVALDPAFAEAHYLLGLCRRDNGDLEQARDALEEARRLAPALTAPREALAEVYGRLGRSGRAIDELEALAALDSARPGRLIAVGLAYAGAGRNDVAVLTLGRAAERFPDAPEVYAALGRVWLDSARARDDRVALNKAIEALTAAATRSNASGATLTDLGRAWLLAGDRAAAERALRQAVARLPVPPDAYLELANVTAADGRLQDARDALLRYAALVGDSQPLAGVATRIADLSVKLGEPGRAVRWLERAVDEAGPTAVLLTRLASAALDAGDLPRARAAVAEGLAADPGSAALRAIARRLQAAEDARR
ncbi:MAG: tetratricopeptide repeat protein [Vicinamibacterales bacterium]